MTSITSMYTVWPMLNACLHRHNKEKCFNQTKNHKIYGKVLCRCFPFLVLYVVQYNLFIFCTRPHSTLNHKYYDMSRYRQYCLWNYYLKFAGTGNLVSQIVIVEENSVKYKCGSFNIKRGMGKQKLFFLAWILYQEHNWQMGLF